MSMTTPAAVPRGGGTSWVVFGWLARLIVAGLFLLAAYSKIIDPNVFIKEVRAYEMLPLQWTNAVALVLPWVEAVCALLLLGGLWRREARLMLVAMLLGFTALKITIAIMGRKVECGCFGDFQLLNAVLAGPMGIALNIFLLAMCWVDWRGAQTRLARNRGFTISAEPAPAA